MKEKKDKEKKLIYLVVFFSLIIFVISIFFIKYELNLSKTSSTTANFNWQQLQEDFKQISDLFKQNTKELLNTNSQTDDSSATALTNEEIEILKEKIENININNINEETNL